VIPANCEVFAFAETINVGGDIRSESNQFPGGRVGRNDRVRITDIESDFDYTLLRFTQQPSRSIDSQIYLGEPEVSWSLETNFIRQACDFFFQRATDERGLDLRKSAFTCG